MLREAAKADDLGALRSAHDDLQKAAHAMAEQLYKGQGAGPRDQASPENKDVREGEVVDA